MIHTFETRELLDLLDDYVMRDPLAPYIAQAMDVRFQESDNDGWLDLIEEEAYV